MFLLLTSHPAPAPAHSPLPGGQVSPLPHPPGPGITSPAGHSGSARQEVHYPASPASSIFPGPSYLLVLPLPLLLTPFFCSFLPPTSPRFLFSTSRVTESPSTLAMAHSKPAFRSEKLKF